MCEKPGACRYGLLRRGHLWSAVNSSPRYCLFFRETTLPATLRLERPLSLLRQLTCAPTPIGLSTPSFVPLLYSRTGKHQLWTAVP